MSSRPTATFQSVGRDEGVNSLDMEGTMRKILYLSLAVAAAFATAPLGAIAQDQDNRSGSKAELAPQIVVPPMLPRYLVTYFKSNTSPVVLRTASIVSITNQSLVSCSVGVQWRAGGTLASCGATLAIPPGGQVDFCTRPIAFGTTICNSTCPGAGLTLHEGNAIVASSSTAACANIAISARTVYTTTTTDFPISAITDAKVVRFGTGNIGD